MVTTLVISVCFWCFLLFHLFLVCFVMLFNQTEIAQKGTHMACCYHWFDRNKTHRLTLSFFFFFPSFLKAPVSKIEILTLWISKLVKRWCSGVVGWVGRHPPLPFINVIRFSITSRFKSNILFSLWQQILLERWGAPPSQDDRVWPLVQRNNEFVIRGGQQGPNYTMFPQSLVINYFCHVSW